MGIQGHWGCTSRALASLGGRQSRASLPICRRHAGPVTCDVSPRASWVPPAQVLPRSAPRVRGSPGKDPQTWLCGPSFKCCTFWGFSRALSPLTPLSLGGFLPALRASAAEDSHLHLRSTRSQIPLHWGSRGARKCTFYTPLGAAMKGAAASPRPAGQHGNPGTVLDSSLALTLHVRLMTKSYRFLSMTIS